MFIYYGNSLLLGADLVILYMNKVVTGLNSKSNSQTNNKEEVFRYVLNLHVLLENPPGDFPANLREDVVKGFREIFAHVRLVILIGLIILDLI